MKASALGNVAQIKSLAAGGIDVRHRAIWGGGQST
jgi:hypothetical protein